MGGREAFAQCVIPDSYVWIVGPTMDLAEKEFRIVWKLAVQEGNIPVARKSERELFIKFKNGSFIECRSEEQPDQLIGEGLDLAVLVEAARLKERTWHQYVRPALADRKGKAFFSSTPRGFNWFEEFYRRGQLQGDQWNDWASWQLPSILNPILGVEEIENARQSTTPEAFAQEWEAKFIHYAGLVFPEFSEEVHVTPLYFQPFLKTCLFVDPGISAPYAVLLAQVTPDEKVHILDEIYTTGKTTQEILKTVHQKWPMLYDTSYDMPDTSVDVIIDQAAAEAAALWRLSGWRAGGTKPKIKQGIEVHHKFLREPSLSRMPMTDGPDDPGVIVPRILFDPKAYNTIREHGQYHYQDDARQRVEKNKSEIPVDIDNHAMDALRYGYFNLFPALFNVSEASEHVETRDLEDLMRMKDAYYSEENGIGGDFAPWKIEANEDARGFSPVEY